MSRKKLSAPSTFRQRSDIWKQLTNESPPPAEVYRYAPSYSSHLDPIRLLQTRSALGTSMLLPLQEHRSSVGERVSRAVGKAAHSPGTMFGLTHKLNANAPKGFVGGQASIDSRKAHVSSDPDGHCLCSSTTRI